jgi:sirohydrochlorin cobaltochelatase
MKRYRHYKKDKAIILSCFGSVIEQNMYEELKDEITKEFDGIDVYLSFSSRMVLKDLEKRDISYQNLPQLLADVDMMGYRNIIVSSINLFPTDEHELLLRTVDGFKNFSYANIRATKAIISKTKETSLLLKALHQEITTQDDVANLYVIHGVPVLDLAGLDAVSYSANFLEMISPQNYTCSLEGAYPWYAIKESIISKIKQDGYKRVQVVPMLLVSGNHYKKDMREISEELSSQFDSKIVDSISKSDRFNLIEMDKVRAIIKQNIKEEIIKLGY